MISLYYLLTGNSGLQTSSDHKYWVYLIWIKCSLQCSLLTRLRWPESHQIFPLSVSLSYFMLTFSLKEKNAWEICKKKTERNSVSVNLSCGRDTGSPRSVILHPQTLSGGKKRTSVLQKSPPLLPASPLLPDLSLTTSVCQSRQDFTHLLHNISSVCRQKKKVWERTNQFERPDKCNKPKVYFSAPSKWVLRYCITLFI